MRSAPPLLFSLLVACWLLALPGRGQVLPRGAYEAALRTIRDSTEMARQAMDLRRPKPRRALRIADAVLRRYPQPIGWQDTTGAAYDTPHVIYSYQHPWLLYFVRARARTALGDLRGAVADFDKAIQYTYVGDRSRVAPNKEFYQKRLDLNLQLHDTAAVCIDVAALWQYDPAEMRRQNIMRRWRCVLPTRKLVVTGPDQEQAYAAGQDSLRRIETLLAVGAYAAARHTADRLIAGEMGGFAEFRSFATDRVFVLRARARQGLGDYRSALADLDTAVSLTSTRRYEPGWRAPLVERGQLKIRHLNNRAGGCADLTEAYRSDTTATAPSHPQWCGCPPPAVKRPAGPAELAEAQAARNDSLRRANERLAAHDYVAVRRLTSPLLHRFGPNTVGQAGRYIGIGPPKQPDVWLLRSAASEGLGDYRGAVAQLDSALLEEVADGYTHLMRLGILKMEHLNDPSGREDLRRAYQRGYRPVDGNWHGYSKWNYQAGQVFKDIFDDLTEVTAQVGYCTQGPRGVMLGALLSPGEAGAAWGPSLGVDVLVEPLLVAPRLAFEGAIGAPFGPAAKLDLTLYSRDGINDLRFTPQVGVTLGALLTAYVGYAIPLTRQQQPFITPVRFAITINFLDASDFFSMKIGG